MNTWNARKLRSLLFVPADSERKLAASLRSNADGLIFDLEDSVPEKDKATAQQILSAFLMEYAEDMRPSLLVRVNGLSTPHILNDLAAVIPHRPDAIVLPKCRGVQDIHRLCDYLSAMEVALLDGNWDTGIIAMATESSEGVFGLSSYRNAPMRLRALMWGVDDLAADLGTLSSHDGRNLTPPFTVARTMCLLAAAQAGIDAIDAVSTDLCDTERIALEASCAKRDGFSAKAAAHPDHIDVINQAFAPRDDEIGWARRVVDAFSSTGAQGVVKLDNLMIDRPHLRLAHRILADVEGTD
ncbi:HpcH/HpaI aldolase/citrate lyase family protein [Cupriavidus taiwanensis]|uniref:HpcH/HpaI aldolase n=1 Tax=Cupriavidus taiwanensis TaxID=164546 RepID=A0A7Z7JHM1_9BURK|nr:CoA ester lyase [Cupriavidus taiwanensis]SOZ17146.1 HpcH/HpaI aldolase [Cupriavidus taiwanensis]SOZ96189.1 HpcH/HpaI aldolase [Cupriavidus taiwanensis]SPC25528.1 HpcH/HpaI aldolase [Cupriavidus taiwanensis]